MAFVDGENLTSRFEAMVKGGRSIRNQAEENYVGLKAVIHEPEGFVWTPSTLRGIREDEDILRIQYYTTYIGDDDGMESFIQRIAELRTATHLGSLVARPMVRLIPKVYKKTLRKTKTKSVDINLCVDVLEYVSKDALDSVFLITGDVDYLPLIKSVMNAGKRVYLASLSEGLSTHLRYATDYFISLDHVYFV